MAQNSWIGWGGIEPKRKRRLNPWEQYDPGVGNRLNTLYDTYPAPGISHGPGAMIDVPGIGGKPGGKPSIWGQEPGVSDITGFPNVGPMPPRDPGKPGGPPSIWEQGPGVSDISGPGAGVIGGPPGAPPDHLPDILGPGPTDDRGPARTPPSAWSRFDLWQPQGGTPGMWRPDFQIEIPLDDPGTTNVDEARDAHFLNWFNQVFPYLSPKDMSTYAYTVRDALDRVDNAEAADYFDRLLTNLEGRNQWDTSRGNYWDVDRLRELRRISNQYFSDISGGSQLGEQEGDAWKIARMLDMLLGLMQPGQTNTPGIWNEDRPMTRRERQAYADQAQLGLGGWGENDPFGAIMRAMLYPTTSSARLNQYITAPASSYYNPQSSNYNYGYSSPRYLGY